MKKQVNYYYGDYLRVANILTSGGSERWKLKLIGNETTSGTTESDFDRIYLSCTMMIKFSYLRIYVHKSEPWSL